jgi:hypothetical protein
MKRMIPLAAMLFWSTASFSSAAIPAAHESKFDYAFHSLVAPDQKGLNVEIFPNPVTEGRLTVQSEKPILSVQILNITGKLVYAQEFKNGTNLVEIELDKVDKGIYLVRVNFPELVSHTEKIMVR